MGILSFIRRIFGKNALSERSNSASEALQSDLKALEQRFEAESSKENLTTSPQSIELEKDSLQLGIAAGYTGRSLKNIESSLVRIESQMITRDWFDLQFRQDMMDLINILRQHEEKEQLRFEAIQNSLNTIRNIASSLPKSTKSKLYEQISNIESNLPLTTRMKEIIRILEETREISYEDLANKLQIGVSSLRGLLTSMAKRTNKIERFEKDGKGWVRIINSIDLNRSQSAAKSSEDTVL
jgi:hypothetical protein